MPSLLAIISADANPMKRELAAVQRMAAQTKTALQSNLSGGHMGQGGIMREALVIMRELSTGRGLNPRTAGSVTILLQRLGLLKAVMGGNVSAAKTLADAWAAQAEKANLASVAAVRKAAASALAFTADEAETEATLNQAVADEEAAAAAIVHAKATQQKAIASAEAAEAAEAEAGVATASVGPLGVVLGVVVALGAAYYIWNKRVQAITDSLSGVKIPDLSPPDLSRFSAQEEGWKKISTAIAEAKEKYDSVSEAADRYEAALRNQHDTEKELLEIQKKKELNAAGNDEARKTEIEQRYRQEGLNLQKKHQNDDLDAMVKRRDALQSDSDKKKKEADAMKVSTKGDEAQNEADLKKRAEAAKEHLFGKKNADGSSEGGVQNEIEDITKAQKSGARGLWERAKLTPEYYWKHGVQKGGDVLKQLEGQAETDRGLISSYENFQKNKKGNETLREYQNRLYNTASSESAQATTLTGKIKDQPTINAKLNENAQKVITADNGAGTAGHSKMLHGHVNQLQAVGAWTAGAAQSSHQTSKAILKHVAKIEKHFEKIDKKPGKGDGAHFGNDGNF